MKQNKWTKTERNGALTYTCKCGDFKLWVTNGHIDMPGYWLASCSGLFQDLLLSVSGKPEFARDAQEMTLQIAIMRLGESINVMREMECGA